MSQAQVTRPRGGWAASSAEAEDDLRLATAHMTTVILSKADPAERLHEVLQFALVFGKKAGGTGSILSEEDLARLAASFSNAPGWEPCPEPDDDALLG